jgi:hypothetical protein
MTQAEQMQHLYDQIFNVWNVVLMVSCWFGLRIAKEVLPELFAKQPDGTPLWRRMPRRLMPVYPVIVCGFFYVAVPGPWIDESLGFGQRAVLGVLCGFITGHGHALLARALPEPLRALLIDGKEARRPRVTAPASEAETGSEEA